MNPITLIKGNLYLAWRALVMHPMRLMLSTDERPGKQRFLDNYASEGLIPFSVEERRVLSKASRCIHCGLCDAYDLALAAQPRTRFDGPSAIPLAWARATPDLPRARSALVALDEEALIRAEKVCPTRVPLRELAETLRAKLAQLDEVAVEVSLPGVSEK